MTGWLSRPAARDALLLAALLGCVGLQVLVEPVPPPTLVWALLTMAPLGARSWAPVAAGLGCQLVFLVGTPAVVSSTGQDVDVLAQGVAAFLVATYAAARGPRTWRGSGSVGLASAALVGAQGLLDPRYGAPGAALANVVYVALAWGVAAVVRTQAERSERSVAERSERAVAEERERLARELHDVVGHSITVMVLRARGGVHEHRVDPGLGLAALREVEEVGTRALADVRMLLELDQVATAPADGTSNEELRPQPGLEDIADLVRRTGSTGLQVALRTDGDPVVLNAGLALTAYRVVQEGLTNVMRHSAARRAEVALLWADDTLVVRVADDGPARAHAVSSGGHGMVGMAERVALVGGTLSAGERPDGGFQVQARLPLAV